MKIRSGEKCPKLANSVDVKIFRANSIWRKGNKIGDVWRSYPCFSQISSSKECNGGFLEVFLYNFKSAWGLVLERLLGMVWMKSQSQDGGKKATTSKTAANSNFIPCYTKNCMRNDVSWLRHAPTICRRLPKNVRRFPLLGNGPAACEFRKYNSFCAR